VIRETQILIHHGKQYIPEITRAGVPSPFRGRPVISSVEVDIEALMELCPARAISDNPVSINLGKCLFCGECEISCPDKIRFTNDHKLATNDSNKLILREGEDTRILLNPDMIRKEIKGIFTSSLKLRQISAAGDNSCEWELNACGNPNFDMGRFGIEFVASPRHADGIVITGPISENMAEAVKICHEAVPSPKIVVLCGVDAISGGIFTGSPAINRDFLQEVQIDLYVPGNPPHPLTFINGILELTRERHRVSPHI
jgi:Ni,Fe-hydrogenase III small subunit/NAD-dependent dihydropyrimidine dehydrogenase PreA subunit